MHFSLEIWHRVAIILMISLESTDQISCSLRGKGKLEPKHGTVALMYHFQQEVKLSLR